jgi:predicted lipid-binding transport protein (Tim44 family)
MLPAVPFVHAEIVPPLPSPVVEQTSPEADETIESQAARAGRGSYRSPTGGYRSPTTGTDRTGRNTRVNEPTGQTPAAPAAGRFGGFFGGLAAGTLLGSILNPFGFGGYGAGFGGFSLIGIVFWAVILYVAYRLIRKWMRSTGGSR